MKILELFAGAGGAATGLHRAGFTPSLLVEWDHDACATLRAAGHQPVYEGDVRNLDAIAGHLEGELDALWSSFPCQAFSSAGKREGAMDDRNGWPWTVAAIDRFRPRWFMGENVTGLTTHAGTDWCLAKGPPSTTPLVLTEHWVGLERADRTLILPPVEVRAQMEVVATQREACAVLACPGCYLRRVIIPQLEERFDVVEWRVLDAAAYGVPQHRRRIFIVAGPRAIRWPEPTHGPPTAQASLFGPGLKPYVTVRDALDLEGTLEASRCTDNNPHQERPSDASVEASPTIGIKGNLYINPKLGVAQGRSEPGDPKHPVVPIDQPMQTMGTRANTYLVGEVRVLGGGTNPRAPGREQDRTLHDITDRPSTTIAAQPGGGAGNAGPFVETRAATEPSRLDKPAPTVTTTEAKGTRGDNMNRQLANGTITGGPDRASDALWLATGRRRLTVEECAALCDFPPGYPFQGTKTSQYKQVGNCVVPTHAEVFGRAVLEADKKS
ncbi:MAG: DNA cytosine methyltransferase [Proteobacteria bacterium]|nr:DNA cytosine methyltransferase [Actinomycetes bacterium]MCP4919532.1 DNA cytosine methyltransferase [Pseudomonadota bacterium]